MLGGPQNRSGRCGEEKYLAPVGYPTPAVQTVVHRDATDTGVIRLPVVSQLPAPTVLPRGERPPPPRYLLVRRLGGAQNRSGRCGGEKHLIVNIGSLPSNRLII
jgi:hypothetical protein